MTLVALVALSTSAWAGKVTWVAAEQDYTSTQTLTSINFGSGVTATLANGGNTNNSPRYYRGMVNRYLQLYRRNTITFNGTNITKITLTFADNETNHRRITCNTAGMNSTSGNTATWTGNANSVSYSVNNTINYEARIQKIEIEGDFAVTPAAMTFNLTQGENAHGTATFRVNNLNSQPVTKAKEGDVVYVTIAPSNGWVVNTVTGQWYAEIALAPQRRAEIDKLDKFELTPVEGQTNTWKFTMQRANAEISVSYKQPLQDAWIQNIAAQTFTGQELTPAITVRNGGTTLVKDRDYTVDYQNNINAGTATVIITAVSTSNYSGTARKTFTINKRALADNFIANIASVTYTGQAHTPEPVVTYNNMTLVKGRDYTVSYENNINAGTAYVIITATNNSNSNYSGTARKGFTIGKKALEDGFIANIADMTYTGQAQRPTPVVTYNGMTLSQGTDYNVRYENNINAGTATVIITATNNSNSNYSGSARKNFTIGKKALENSFIADIPAQTYTGQPLQPAIVVTYNNMTLRQGTDYSVVYENNTEAGEATVIITAIGNNYSGTAEKKFTINTKVLEDSYIANIEAMTYTGEALEPAPVVTYNGMTLVKDRDYTVSYQNNTNAGTATVIVTGMGNYSGTAKKEFTIIAKTLEESFIEDIEAPTFTGAELEPAPVVIYNGMTLVEGTDFTTSYTNNTNAGTAILTVTGMGNYSGTVIKTFNINKKELEDSFIAEIDAQLYTGEAQEPEPVVTYNGLTLIKDRDYTVSYTNNKLAGTATVTITAISTSNYSGSASKDFIITTKTLANSFIEDIEDQVYTGKPVKPDPVVTYNGMTLVKDVDYSYTYSNNVEPGTATLTIAGMGIYKGVATKDFTIIKKALEDSFIADIDAQTFTGEPLEPAIVVTYNSMKLVEGTDYTVAYKDNTNSGTATVTITAVSTSNYTGTASKTFTINNQSLKNADIAGIDDVIYNGKAQEPEPVVTYNGTTLVKGTDYTVTYENNTEAGTATVTVKGKGDYSGTVTKDFTIKQKDLEDAFLADFEAQTYTGEALEPAVVMTYNGMTLVEGTDYVVAYKNNTNAGPATVTITAKGNYSGTLVKMFTIATKEMEDGFIADIDDVTYNGQAQKPEPVVTFNGKELVKGTDYVVVYSNNIYAGTATLTVKGMRNFSGSASKTFNINKVALTIKADDMAVIFGAEVPKYTVSYDGFVNNETKVALSGKLVFNCEYEQNSPIGEYTITPSGLTSNNYEITFVEGTLTVAMDPAAVDVMNKIDAIGVVELTPECKALIDAAREAYDALNDAQKTLVDNYQTLLDAEARYAELESETTAINGLDTAADENEWYDMNGRKLNGKPSQKGMYIMNGKKVVIK